jgi:hypothetical protein
MQEFTFAARGRHYTVKTEQLGTALTMTNFWTLLSKLAGFEVRK